MMIYLLNSVIFHSYAKLPEGNEIVNSHSINYNIYIITCIERLKLNPNWQRRVNHSVSPQDNVCFSGSNTLLLQQHTVQKWEQNPQLLKYISVKWKSPSAISYPKYIWKATTQILGTTTPVRLITLCDPIPHVIQFFFM